MTYRLSPSQIQEALALQHDGFSNSEIAEAMADAAVMTKALVEVRARRLANKPVPLSLPDFDKLVAQLFDPPRSVVSRAEKVRA